MTWLDYRAFQFKFLFFFFCKMWGCHFGVLMGMPKICWYHLIAKANEHNLEFLGLHSPLPNTKMAMILTLLYINQYQHACAIKIMSATGNRNFNDDWPSAISLTGFIHSCSSRPNSFASTCTVAVLPAPADPVNNKIPLDPSKNWWTIDLEIVCPVYK